MRPLLVAAAVLATRPCATLALCYFPDGSVAPQDSPCSDDTAQSTCCGQGYACLSNNVCMATGREIQKPGATTFSRGSCTDRSWRSGACPNFCADPEADNVGGGEGMGRCERDAKLFYCINAKTKPNCDKMENILIFQVAPSVITTIGVSPSSTSSANRSDASSTASRTSSSSAASLTATPTNNVSPPSSPSPETSSSTGAKTGIGVGVGVGVTALLAAGALWFVLRRRRAARAAAPPPAENTNPATDPTSSKPPGPDIAWSQNHPSPGVSEVQGMPAYEYTRRQTMRYELPGA
ncbi:Uncharacterized protein TPAR_08408 [Tolypocladium paradoxum]|uniref:Mid2 domain-containing protein n=1 Tax=Tolypocladium paradoxum TaxID=94208 RepID=A0A2S4KME1_9HYPO|nr:Uncharacterized protein TPAR_08408 [Tolypocladium paradoxum]